MMATENKDLAHPGIDEGRQGDDGEAVTSEFISVTLKGFDVKVDYASFVLSVGINFPRGDERTRLEDIFHDKLGALTKGQFRQLLSALGILPGIPRGKAGE